MVVGEFTHETDLLVIGGGPGGYTAAFGAAARGISTTLVEATDFLGGVCLHRGCIPSKTYLSMAETIQLAKKSADMGVKFAPPELDVSAMRGWKEQVVTKLAGGLDMQSKKYKVERLKGIARFEDPKHVALEGGEVSHIKFRRAVIATGSRSIFLKGIQVESPRVLTSRTALDLPDIPKTLLVIGGGVYRARAGSSLRRVRRSGNGRGDARRPPAGCGSRPRSASRKATQGGVRRDLPRNQGGKHEGGQGRHRAGLRG